MKSGYVAPAPMALDVSGLRIGLLTTRWNPEIVEALATGARRALSAWGIAPAQIIEHRVPGAYELPLAAARLFNSGGCDGVITLGAVIRGETPHFDFVAGECARGLMDVQLRAARPIGFGVLTVNDLAQAEARAGAGDDNKGYEAASAMLEMLAMLKGVE